MIGCSSAASGAKSAGHLLLSGALSAIDIFLFFSNCCLKESVEICRNPRILISGDVSSDYISACVSALEFAASQSSFSYSEPGARSMVAGRNMWLLALLLGSPLDTQPDAAHPSSNRIPSLWSLSVIWMRSSVCRSIQMLSSGCNSHAIQMRFRSSYSESE